MAEEKKYKKVTKRDKEGNVIGEEFVEIEEPINTTTNEKKPFYKKTWFKVVAGLFVIGVIGNIINPPKPTDKTETETKVSKVAETEKVNKTENISEEKEETKTEMVTELKTETEIETEAYIFNSEDFEAITYEQLARNPEDHSFKAIQLEGRIIQVIEGADISQYRLAVDDDYDKIVLIEVPKELIKNNRILENDYIKVYGTSIGMFEYTSTIGGQISVPGMIVDKFDFL